MKQPHEFALSDVPFLRFDAGGKQHALDEESHQTICGRDIDPWMVWWSRETTPETAQCKVCQARLTGN